MPGFFIVLDLVSFAVAIAAGVLVLFLVRRLRRAEVATTAALRQAEGRTRCLGLMAQELQQYGFALLGQAGPEAAAGHRLLALADDVAEYLAAESGPRRLAAAPVPLASLLEEAVAAITAQLGAGRRQWRISPEFGALALEADRRALRGALVPVLGRAARMTRESEWIDLRPVLTADSLAIVVEDEGAGLPAEDLSGATPDGTRGLGFGLAVARSLLEAHGGSLRLEALPGVGARAWLNLPRELLVAIPGPAAPPG
jgi:signal transduction histidine kinase